MTQKRDLLDIVLPCYNPQEGFLDTFAPIAEELRRLYPDKELHFIVVNDGSTRNFGDTERQALLAAVPNLEIVDQIPNRGKGAAVRAGLRVSTAAHAIYTDFDMPYSIETIREVIDRVFAGDDVVIAIRNRSYYSQLSPLRKVMSHGSKFLNSLLLRIKHTDTQGGLKGFSPRAREIMLRTTIDDFLFDTEFVVQASRDRTIRITEIESTLRSGVELSKMSFKVIVRELRNFLRIAFLSH